MTDTDEEAIRAMIEARNDAVRDGDVLRAIGPLSPAIVSYDLQPPLLVSGAFAGDTDGMKQWLDTWEGPVEVDMPSPTIAASGDLAFAYGLSHMCGRKRGEGDTDLWYRTTLCLRRVSGRWSIVHEHNSVPMMMDGSGLAATGLTPVTADRRV